MISRSWMWARASILARRLRAWRIIISSSRQAGNIGSNEGGRAGFTTVGVRRRFVLGKTARSMILALL
jgi:hypothetical protein